MFFVILFFLLLLAITTLTFPLTGSVHTSTHLITCRKILRTMVSSHMLYWREGCWNIRGIFRLFNTSFSTPSFPTSGVDFSDKLPPHSPVLRLLARQSLLPQVHIYTVHPAPLQSSFPSPPLHIHLRQSFLHIFFSDSHIMSEPLSLYFLHLRGYLSSLLIISFLILSIFVTPQLYLNILISTTSNFFSCAFFTAHVSTSYIIASLSSWPSSWFFCHKKPLTPSSNFRLITTPLLKYYPAKSSEKPGTNSTNVPKVFRHCVCDRFWSVMFVFAKVRADFKSDISVEWQLSIETNWSQRTA